MKQASGKKAITSKQENFDRWYTDVIQKAELADYAPVKGCMVIRPYGYAIWERIQAEFNTLISKEGGVENAYFPLLIPSSFLKKEKDHVEGFSPQLAVVTHGGGERLTEALAVRPTSETIIYHMFAKWISSWRDLPFKINQWANIVRWEKRTSLFLRTTEFLWQEGHTAHESEKEGIDFALKALDWYRRMYEDVMAIYPLTGRKSESEKFAGAVNTYSVEALMSDGMALQAATSHYLGQNFSRAFDIVFQNRQGKNEHAFQTSWGLSTRSIGGIIMAHGDDEGLLLPPKIAPFQVVIVPVAIEEKTVNYSRKIKEILEKSGIRVKLDDRETKTAGWKFNEWELKGAPLRLEIGKREVEAGEITLFRRDTKLREVIKAGKAVKIIALQLEEIQKMLFERHKKFTHDSTRAASGIKELGEIIKEHKGFIKAFWCGSPACESEVKNKTKATTRNLSFADEKEEGKCLVCGKKTLGLWNFALAY